MVIMPTTTATTIKIRRIASSFSRRGVGAGAAEASRSRRFRRSRRDPATNADLFR
jgi:hypothetical protein